MPFVETRTGRLFYATRGQEGVPVLFVHGSGSSHLVWNGQLAALAGQARSFALDLPGHGRSNQPGRNSVRAYADVICEWMDTLALERAVVVGHSLGGAIAQLLAIENPERVQAIGLVGTGARLRVLPAFLEGLLTDFAPTAGQITEAEFAPQAPAAVKQASEQQLLASPPEVVHDDFAACDQFDVRARLGEIRAPALVLCGSGDRMTPVKYSQYLASQISNSRLVVVPDAGHMVMVEQPEAVNSALAAWLPTVE